MDQVALAVVAVGRRDAARDHRGQAIGRVVLVGRAAIREQVAVGIVLEAGVRL